MKKINDGGYAFPSVDHMGDGPNGMTLRQWYVGKAVQGVCANADITKAAANAGLKAEDFRKSLVSSVFVLADALLAFEEKEREGNG